LSRNEYKQLASIAPLFGPKMRQEGRNYQVRDGDVILFRFNV